MKQKFSICSIMAVSVFWLSSCAEKTEFVSSQSQSNWKNADPAALAAATPEDTPDILPQTHYAAGRLFEKQGAAVRAAKQYKKALLRNPEHVPSLSRLGMIYAKQGHYPEAEQYLQRAVEIWPNSPQARNNLGFCYIMQERWYDAEAEFRNTLKLDPSFVRARVNLAMALSKLNRFDEALGEFRLAVPEPEAYYNLGLLYRSAQRYQEAASAFETALKRKPGFTIAEQQLARMKLQLQRTSDFQIDTQPSPQPTEFASNNNTQRRESEPRQSNMSANQSVEMQPITVAQTAKWTTTSTPPKGSPTASQSVETQAVETQTADETQTAEVETAEAQTFEAQTFEAQTVETQTVETQAFERQPQQESVQTTSNVQTMSTMEPVESSTSDTQSPAPQGSFVGSVHAPQQQSESSEAPEVLQASSQPTQAPVTTPQSSVAVYEMQPMVEVSESNESVVEESSQIDEVEVARTDTASSDAMQTEAESPADVEPQYQGVAQVGTPVQYTPERTAPQKLNQSEIPTVRPVYVAVGQTTSNAPSTAQAASPVNAQVASDAQPVTPTKSAVASNPDALVLEVTPIEMDAPVQTADQTNQPAPQRSTSRSIPADPAPKAVLTSDLSEIESVEPVEPASHKTQVAPKKAKTATHRPNADDVEVKSMGAVSAAARKPLPQPRTHAMPEADPQEAVEPDVLDMEPVTEADDADDSDAGKDEAEVEIVEMEAVED